LGFTEILEAISKIALPLKMDLRKAVFARTVLNQRDASLNLQTSDYDG
jgi:hypothetical protein